MMNRIFLLALAALLNTALAYGQAGGPSAPSRPYVVRTKQQVTDAFRAMEKQDGNKNVDIFPAVGAQTRVAVFHDEKRENDSFEVHELADDIYYVLEGTATLMLGGTLVGPDEISPGEWRSKHADGGERVSIGKGDLIVVPRGTPHQRTVTGKSFSMILIKVFAEPAKQ